MKRSKAYRAAAEKIDEAKVYAPLAAVRLAKASASASSDAMARENPHFLKS